MIPVLHPACLQLILPAEGGLDTSCCACRWLSSRRLDLCLGSPGSRLLAQGCCWLPGESLPSWPCELLDAPSCQQDWQLSAQRSSFIL